VELSEILNMCFSTACPAQSDHVFFKYLAMDGLNETTVFKNKIKNSELENTEYVFYSENNAEGVTKNNCNG